MKVKKHIVVSIAKAPELLTYLEENNILFKYLAGDKTAIVLDIYNDNPHWITINSMLENKKFFCMSNTEFTREELNSAQWLTMRSIWHYDYPQPSDAFGYLSVTYSGQNICGSCGVGQEQVAPFRIKKAPKWGQRHFMMLYWVGDEIFLDDVAKNTLQDSNLQGISFEVVKNKQGNEFFSNVHQLVIPYVLTGGLVNNTASIEEITICPKCGATKYIPSGIGMYSFKREIFENAPDIVRTEEIFGGGAYASRLIIVSNRFYTFIKENKLGRNLEFQPIELV